MAGIIVLTVDTLVRVEPASNNVVATATSDLLLGFYLPSWSLWAGRPVVRAIMDPPLIVAMGFTPAPAWLCSLVASALKVRARVLRRLPPRRGPGC